MTKRQICIYFYHLSFMLDPRVLSEVSRENGCAGREFTRAGSASKREKHIEVSAREEVCPKTPLYLSAADWWILLDFVDTMYFPPLWKLDKGAAPSAIWGVDEQQSFGRNRREERSSARATGVGTSMAGLLQARCHQRLLQPAHS